MAEMVTALEKDELEGIFRSELSLNQFNKAFNTLNSLNLLVIKSQIGKKELFELHPLVKEYVLHKYKQNERVKFITLIVNFYDQIIVWIKPKLDADSPLTYFEKYTQRAELQINHSNFKSALSSLYEISTQILAAGFNEEYMRVLNLLFDKIDWLKSVTEEYQYFHQQLYVYIQLLTEKGKFEDAQKGLDHYKEVIQGKSIYYLNYCSLNSYHYWFKADYKAATEWAERGIALQKSSGIGLEIDLEHKLALALRDTKNLENIQIALQLMSQGESLDNILSKDFSLENFNSSFFGNIGRCLWFQEKFKEAVICYYKILFEPESGKK